MLISETFAYVVIYSFVGIWLGQGKGPTSGKGRGICVVWEI